MNTVSVGKLAKKKMNQNHGGHGLQIWLKIHLAIILSIIGGSALIFFMLIALLMLLVATSGSDPSSSCSTGAGMASNVPITGGDGNWTKKGTKEYNATKEMFQDAEAQGLNAEHAAAMVGNGLEESGMFGVDVGQPFSIKPHQTVGPGIGLYMFTRGMNVPKDMSIEGQTKAILNNDLQGSKSSYIHASGSISDLAEDFRADFEGGDKNPMREEYANKAYQIFGGMKGSTGDADSTADASASSQCGSDSNTGSTNIIKFAKSQIGKHPYHSTDGHRNDMYLSHNKVGSGADCSSFAYYVYYHCGMKVPPFNGNSWSVEGTVKGPKQVSASQTEAGSICQNTVHMVILEEKYHGPNTKCVEEGGGTATHPNEDNVNESTVGMAYGNEGGGYLFFNPVKK